MKTVTTFADLPLVLTVKDVQQVLLCAKDVAYALVHTPGFPTVRIGKSIRIPRDRFMAWLDAQTEVDR